MEAIYVIVAILAILIIKGIYDKKKLIRDTRAWIKRTYGEVPKQSYSEEKRKSLQYYHNTNKKNENSIDDITWNDLDMNQIFMTVNATCSSVGEEYLYSLLRNPVFDKKELEERERLINHFSKDKDARENLQMLFCGMGKMKNFSVFEYVSRMNDIKYENNAKHISQAVLLAGAIACIFVAPVYGIIGTIVMFFYNTITYFKRKGEIEKYFAVVSYVIRILDAVNKMKSINDPEISEYRDRLIKIAGNFKSFRSGATVVTPKNPNGDMMQGMADYFRIAFHIDLIKFNSMLCSFVGKTKEFHEMFEILGLLDSMIAVASYRELMQEYCVPEFIYEKECRISAVNIYHPMLNEPVPNSIEVNNSVLITGSNASGKSTFIKTIAINAILAQTINTVTAQSYKTSFFKVMTSMALQDNLSDGDSYYIVEIKSLKRILDSINDEIPVLCFVDEVLRGTNTLERIAASSQILSTLARSNAICFAATHDIELTYILENVFTNHHFKEHIEDNDVLFDYIIHEGRAVSRNAIKLLSILGYGDDIIETATKAANNYLETGEWGRV